MTAPVFILRAKEIGDPISAFVIPLLEGDPATLSLLSDSIFPRWLIGRKKRPLHLLIG